MFTLIIYKTVHSISPGCISFTTFFTFQAHILECIQYGSSFKMFEMIVCENSLFKMIPGEIFLIALWERMLTNGLGPGLASSFTLILKTAVDGVGRIIFTLELGRSCQLIILLFGRGAMIHTQVCVPASHYTGDFLSNVY